MLKEIVAYPYICLGDCEAINRRHPRVSNPKPMAHLEFFGGEGELLTLMLYRILFKKKMSFMFLLHFSIHHCTSDKQISVVYAKEQITQNLRYHHVYKISDF